MKTTPQAWWCQCGTRNEPQDRLCDTCGRAHYERFANVRAADRAVVYYNPATGEHKTPPRADQSMPEVYSRQGFVRRDIDSMLSWEKESGTVHEATNFNSGNEPKMTEQTIPKRDPEAMKAVVDDLRQAFASGEWTGGL